MSRVIALNFALLCAWVGVSVMPRAQRWHDDQVRRASVVRVVDGDTFDARVQLLYATEHVSRFRVLNFDAWETRGDEREKGLAAKAALALLLKDEVFLRGGVEQDKYGRWLVSLRLLDGSDPVEAMRKAGHEKK